MTFLENRTDVLVIGGGIAGIRAAIEASEQGAEVTIINKGAFCKDGAAVWMAGNGFQAALYPPDSVETHVMDTIKGGWYLNNQTLVKTFLAYGLEAVADMNKWGVRLAKKDKKFYQLPFPGHSFPRSVCGKPGLFLGPEYRKAFYRQTRKKAINVKEDFFASDLLVNGDTVGGVIGLDALEARNMVDVAEQVCTSALMRTETRGLHERVDFPKTDPGWLKHIMIQKAGEEMKLFTEPVDMCIVQPEKEGKSSLS